MRKLLLLIVALLGLGVSGAWAETWENKSGWTQASGGVGAVTWFGVHTPGDATTVYNLTQVKIMQQTGNANNDNYLAITRSSATSSIGVNEVIAISDNHLAASQGSASLESYNFEDGVNLLGGTTYYIVFLSSNSATNGAYPVRSSRLCVNHLDYGNYTYGCSSASWWPYFTAEVTTTDAVSYGSLTYSYQINGKEITTQTIENLVEGHIYPSATASLGYGYSYSSPAGNITNADLGNTKVIPVTWTSFSYADSYKNITKWYTIRMHSSQTHYMKSSGSAMSFTGTKDASNDYLWGFVGNPVDGFQIYPYNNGSVAIDDANPCTLSAVGTTNTLKVTQGANGSYGATADFCVAMYVTNGNYYNYRAAGNIQRWSGNDEGSAWMIDESTPASLVEGSTVESPIYYAWRTAVSNNEAYISVNGSGAPVNANNTPLPDDTNPISDAYAWQFIGDATNGYLIKNKQSGTYLGGRTEAGGAMSMEAEANTYFRPISVATTNKWYCETYKYYIDRSSGAPYAHTSGNNNDYVRLYNVKFVLSDAGSGLKVGTQTISDFDIPVLITTNAVLSCVDEDYNISTYDGYMSLADALENDADGVINVTVGRGNPISYHLTWNGEALSTEIKYQRVGNSTYDGTTVFGAAPVYCSYGTPNVSEIGESTSDVNIALEWAGPFTVSADFANATWYYMTLRNSYYAIYDPSSENKTSTTATTAKSDAVATAERALWAFTGNPINGFRVMNKAAGDGLYLNSYQSPLRMQADNSYAIWMLNQNGTGFTLNNEGYYINDVNNNLGYWNAAEASTDEGSTMRVEAVDYYELAQAYLTQFATANAIADDGYFGVRPSDATALSNQYSTAFSANHASVTASLYENTLKPSIEDLIKYPETGYYRIKSSGARGQSSYITYGFWNEDKGTGLLTTSGAKETDFGTVVKLNRDGSSKNYTFSIQGLNVKAHSGDNALIRANDESAATYSIQTINGQLEKCSIYDGTNHGYFHEAGWYNSTTGLNAIVGWEVGDGTNASTWSIEDATSVTIQLNVVDDKSYATMYLPFDVTLPSGTSAYTVSISSSRAKLDLIAAAGGVTTIPSGTPVLLVNESASSSVVAAITSGATAIEDENALEGTYLGKSSLEDNEYIFGTRSGELGFWKMASGNKVGANKAYLVYNGDPSNVKGFSIDFSGVTGIGSVANGKQTKDNDTYDLSGRRVSNPTRGLYIVNGKKVAVK